MAVPGRLTVLLSVLSTVALTACGSNSSTHAAAARHSSTTSSVVKVVAGENVWGDIVAQIGGAHVKVSSIISDPNTDPHEYESDVHDAASVANAQLVIENGLGYDDFLKGLVGSSGRSQRDVLSVQNVLHIEGDNPNPHVWYDIARLPEVAGAICVELAKYDPADSAAFTSNTKAFDASLKPILAVIAAIKAAFAGTKIAYTERVPAYLTEAAGLRLGVPTGFTRAVEDGNDPSAGDTAAFDAAIENRTVAVLLYNSQVTDNQTTKIKQLATSHGVPIVGVTETLPSSDKNFQAWQLRQGQELLAALKR